ncbi:hypothetical protein PF010_g6120 [Phytophthora fragariae]|uniref:Pectate lyase n=2 Tax=Phytophthora TaxID=4783 RepID=A0A6G0NX77_9STRA|nr:hypothetical protein PR002_g7319 [Phytophthora rubi]KAE9124168.1 hypothetical protein PF010_g6120 [Phytophthora fragariae]KAE9046192.1 hypothetical protein PR001_g4673 [Phytophthora rubi]KAE9226148.1 hypothetical protein PF004_g11726 [Phytophthora fragariae]KAE9350610.1 hypothetical protein PF008_g6339 [Phytophthora fragariae]
MSWIHVLWTRMMVGFLRDVEGKRCVSSSLSVTDIHPCTLRLNGATALHCVYIHDSNWWPWNAEIPTCR